MRGVFLWAIVAVYSIDETEEILYTLTHVSKGRLAQMVRALH